MSVYGQTSKSVLGAPPDRAPGSEYEEKGMPANDSNVLGRTVWVYVRMLGAATWVRGLC